MPAVTPGTTSNGMPARAQRLRLLAAAAEHERVAALEPHDACARRARARPAGASVSLLGHLLAAADLADVDELGVRARAVERLGGISRSWRIDVGASRCSSSARAVSRPGSPGPAPTR